MNQKLQSVRRGDAEGVKCLRNHGNLAVGRGINLAVRHNHSHTVAKSFGGKYVIGYVADRNSHAVRYGLKLMQSQICFICNSFFGLAGSFLLISRFCHIQRISGRIGQNGFKSFTDTCYGHAYNDLHGLAVFGNAVCTDALKVSVVLYKRLVLDIDTEAGCTVGHVHNVVGAAKALQDKSGQHSLFVHFRAAGLLCTELRFGVEFRFIRILTSRCLKVELDNQEPEYHKPDARID